MSPFRKSLPMLVVLFVSAGFLTVDLWDGLTDPTRPLLLALPPLVISAVAIVGTSLMVGRRVVLYHRLRMAVTPVALIIGTYGHFILVERAAYRFALIIALAALFTVYFRRVARMSSLALSEKAEFAWFTYALHVAAAFLTFSAAYGVSRLLHPPMVALAVVITILLVVVTFETLRRYGIGARHSAPVAIATGVMTAELFVAVALLPTGHLVNAAVMTVLYALALRIFMQVMGHKGDTKGLRRQVAASAGLVVILLATARWI